MAFGTTLKVRLMADAHVVLRIDPAAEQAMLQEPRIGALIQELVGDGMAVERRSRARRPASSSIAGISGSLRPAASDRPPTHSLSSARSCRGSAPGRSPPAAGAVGLPERLLRMLTLRR